MANPDEAVEKTLATLGVGPAAKELYVDLLRPAAREMGGNLVAVAKLVTAALTPLHAAVWGLDRVRDWLSTSLVKRLAAVPPENIQPPPAYIAGQVLLQLPFCADEEHIRERYADLLATAMNREQVGSVHAAFVHVIQQLSPDEALLLESVRARGDTFALNEEWDDEYEFVGDTIELQFRDFCTEAGVANVALSDVYLENLIRLGVLRVQQSSKGEYEPAGHNRYGEYPARVATMNGRVVEVGDFGAKFLAACVRSVTPKQGAA
jgi:hypothetical protein